MEKPNTSMKFTSFPKPGFRITLQHRLLVFVALLAWVIWCLRPYSRLVYPEGHREMNPSIQSGQTLYLYAHQKFSNYQKGDIVWYSSPKNSTPRMGRIIAKVGDAVSIRKGILFCNEESVAFPLQGLPDQLDKNFPTLEAGQMMIVHDQQAAPVEDSLTLGPLEENNTVIFGKLFFYSAKEELRTSEP